MQFINKKGYVFSDEEEAYIIQQYTSQHTGSMRQIAGFFGVDYTVIKKILLKNNIEIKHNSELKRGSVDDNFFDIIDTEEKAYIFGFFCADGFITKENMIKFRLSIKDREFLEKIRGILKVENTIHVEKNFTGYKDKKGKPFESCVLYFRSKKIHEDLTKKGITQNKTKDLRFPINFIPKNLVRHFIRGFFDGDGTFSIYNNKKKKQKRAYFGFIGTQNFIGSIKNILPTQKKNNFPKISFGKGGLYSIRYGSKSDIITIYEYLYNDSNIYLERKKRKAEEYLGYIEYEKSIGEDSLKKYLEKN